MEWPKDGPNEMKWPKDGPNENEMAQDGPNKGEKINLEYARKKSLEKSSV